MSFLYVCNTSSDYISKINLDLFKEESKIPVGMDKTNKAGPHDLYAYNNTLLVANSYSNSLSIVDIDKNCEIENYFIGMHCNGVRVYDENAYVICGETNSIVVFNLIKKKIIEEIPCGSFPHSIDINLYKKLIAVANMHSDSITLIDCCNRENIVDIKVSAYPTKVLFSKDGEWLLVCESRMGMIKDGTLNIIDLNTLKSIGKIELGNSPVDIFTNENYCYVSNFGDGTISILDIESMKEIKRIKVGGMPRGIVQKENYIYVGDNYNNLLIQVNIEKENKKVITIGGEPTGMTLY